MCTSRTRWPAPRARSTTCRPAGGRRGGGGGRGGAGAERSPGAARPPPADPAARGPDVPARVGEALDVPGFLADQPSLVLRLGPDLPAVRTVMFNVHLDTVAGVQPVGFDGECF